MTDLVLREESLTALKGRVVVVTGGSRGIGLATVQQLYQIGSKVVFGDLANGSGVAVAKNLPNDEELGLTEATFVEVDVSQYDSVLNLFERALSLYGRVDAVIHCAAVGEQPGWFEPSLDMDSARKCPSTKIFDINLLGTYYVTQIALAAMKQTPNDAGSKTDKSILLISSVAGFKESPGLFAYTATKHGVIGLMRSSRAYFPAVFGVRINVVCPWATDTAMLEGVRSAWTAQNLPLNTPDHVARINIEAIGNPDLNGKAFYVAGGKAVDVEEGINDLEPQWLGKQKALDLARGQEVLGMGGDWIPQEKPAATNGVKEKAAVNGTNGVHHEAQTTNGVKAM